MIHDFLRANRPALFKLYRAWVIWIDHRKYIIIPAGAFLASFSKPFSLEMRLETTCNLTFRFHLTVVGIYWIVKDITTPEDSTLLESISHWETALGFSCALDGLTTAMIAGRLIYHHRKQQRLMGSRKTFYLPVIAIFIESAMIFFIAKILQIAIHAPSKYLEQNPLVVPLCVSVTVD
jgi:hypothetical protein